MAGSAQGGPVMTFYTCSSDRTAESYRLTAEEHSVAKESRLKDLKDLRYTNLFSVVWVALVITWCFVSKSPVERALLPVLCPETRPAAARLRVTNNDGTLSNGAKLRGWRYTAYFAAHGGLCLGGTLAFTVALAQIWPIKPTLIDDEARKALKKPAPVDDLA